MNNLYFVSVHEKDHEIDHAIYSTFNKAVEACKEHYMGWFEWEEFINKVESEGDEDYYTINVYPDNTIDFAPLNYIITPLKLDEPLAIDFPY
jgi:hypothetical protein